MQIINNGRFSNVCKRMKKICLRRTFVSELHSRSNARNRLAINYSSIMSVQARHCLPAGAGEEILRVGSFFRRRVFSIGEAVAREAESSPLPPRYSGNDSTRKFAVLSEIHTRGGPHKPDAEIGWTSVRSSGIYMRPRHDSSRRTVPSFVHMEKNNYI